MQFVRFEPVTQSFDVVFQSAVLGATALLAPRGVRLPLLPVYGCSVMAPMRYFEADPQLEPALGRDGRALQSAHRPTGHTLAGGRRCRVGRGGSPHKHHVAALAALHEVLNDRYLGVAKLAQTQTWKDARPNAARPSPVLRPGGIPSVWMT